MVIGALAAAMVAQIDGSDLQLVANPAREIEKTERRERFEPCGGDSKRVEIWRNQRNGWALWKANKGGRER